MQTPAGGTVWTEQRTGHQVTILADSGPRDYVSFKNLGDGSLHSLPELDFEQQFTPFVGQPQPHREGDLREMDSRLAPRGSPQSTATDPWVGTAGQAPYVRGGAALASGASPPAPGSQWRTAEGITVTVDPVHTRPERVIFKHPHQPGLQSTSLAQFLASCTEVVVPVIPPAPVAVDAVPVAAPAPPVVAAGANPVVEQPTLWFAVTPLANFADLTNLLCDLHDRVVGAADHAAIAVTDQEGRPLAVYGLLREDGTMQLVVGYVE